MIVRRWARRNEHPQRFAVLAAIPLQDPPKAAADLRRAIEVGLCGALVNDHTLGHYLDEPQYAPFWETLQDLEIPLYMLASPQHRTGHSLSREVRVEGNGHPPRVGIDLARGATALPSRSVIGAAQGLTCDIRSARLLDRFPASAGRTDQGSVRSFASWALAGIYLAGGGLWIPEAFQLFSRPSADNSRRLVRSAAGTGGVIRRTGLSLRGVTARSGAVMARLP